MKLVYDEWFGTLSYAQRAAYRKYNVSPYEHDRLCEHYGEDDHAAITTAVKDSVGPSGMFELRLAISAC